MVTYVAIMRGSAYQSAQQLAQAAVTGETDRSMDLQEAKHIKFVSSFFLNLFSLKLNSWSRVAELSAVI